MTKVYIAEDEHVVLYTECATDKMLRSKQTALTVLFLIVAVAAMCVENFGLIIL